MRKLPSSASVGNLRQLVDTSPNDVIYSSNGSSMVLPVSTPPTVPSIGPCSDSTNVAMSDIPPVTGRKAPPQQRSSGNSTGNINTEDRGKKRGLAYRLTKFHRLLDDNFGKSYERRGCSYCDAVFSFRGGTTSAALRHLKTTHPERLVSNAGTSTGSEQQSVQRDFSVDENQSLIVQENVRSGDQVAAASADCNGDFDRNNQVAATAVDTVASTVGGSGEEDSLVSVETMSSVSRNDRRRPAPKRKRERYIVENGSVSPSGGEHSGETSSERGESWWGSSSKLTASQTAILHFLHHYANELPHPAMRLRFARHFTHNVAEAEMYNVLDPATQIEYIREFTHASPPNM